MVTVNHIQFPIDLSEFSPDAPIAGLHAILHVPSIHPRPIRGEVTAGAYGNSLRGNQGTIGG
jgi:hypothetical protein